MDTNTCLLSSLTVKNNSVSFSSSYELRTMVEIAFGLKISTRVIIEMKKIIRIIICIFALIKISKNELPYF